MIQDQNSEFRIRIQNSEIQVRIKGFSSIFNLHRRLGAAFTLHRLADELAVKVSRISMHLALLHGVLELDERVVLRVRQTCAICASSSLEHVHFATRDMGEGSAHILVEVGGYEVIVPSKEHLRTTPAVFYAVTSELGVALGAHLQNMPSCVNDLTNKKSIGQ
eukprot:COSAG02_NODE_30183_length_555_cov_22.997807_1_plen_162_part_01